MTHTPISFFQDKRGTALTEAALVLPLLVVFWMAILAFGITFQQTQVVETAARDAARFLSRVDDPAASVGAAQNLAVFANTAGTGAARARGITTGDVVITFQDTANPVNPVTGERQFAGPDPIQVVRVEITFDAAGAAFFNTFGFTGLRYRAAHEERVLGE
jgi:Flp pilus assembly protein TadG